eukprot:NODE_4683_length_776_cov_12.694635_g4339_i0.p1 GENE.NODE_4683_length_776_cov_12.694635_g4339_i0~~NODE_4683_length_776_cov_12.694635_g4339_i0.p1  ORF type:complete len:175 (+),score=47.76 NODE_4683_length_776_cov_12.694635_g4339_i0:182-706(+)
MEKDDKSTASVLERPIEEAVTSVSQSLVHLLAGPERQPDVETLEEILGRLVDSLDEVGGMMDNISEVTSQTIPDQIDGDWLTVVETLERLYGKVDSLGDVVGRMDCFTKQLETDVKAFDVKPLQRIGRRLSVFLKRKETVEEEPTPFDGDAALRAMDELSMQVESWAKGGEGGQ